MKKTILSWIGNPIIFILIIDIFLSNLWVFWKNTDSNNPIFAIEDKHVDMWIWDLCWYIRALLLTITIVVMYINKVKLQTKQIWFVAIYFIMGIKDIFDFLHNGNQGTLLADVLVFLVTIMVCEVISKITENG